jgi:hypothetical protein
VRHQSVTYTGIVLTVSTLSWTATSWVMQHYVHRWGPRVFVRLGFALGTGIAGAAVAQGEAVGWVEADSRLVGAVITGSVAVCGLVLASRVPRRLAVPAGAPGPEQSEPSVRREA